MVVVGKRDEIGEEEKEGSCLLEMVVMRRREEDAAGDAESSSNIGRSNSSSNVNDNTPETSYESGENGHKIAFDPRDISESAERSKQPKLTLMEEVLLLGLKDKQVGISINIIATSLVPERNGT